MASVAKNELREREMTKHFRHKGTWLEAVPSKNRWVNQDVIKLNEIGADPSVLIDNTSYPIATSTRTDTSTAVSLKKFETENTRVTDDELYALPYDKVGSVQTQHRETLEEATQAFALHNIAPAKNSADTPVLKTTGADDGSGRKRLKYDDLVALKKALDLLKIPKKGRVLVLAPNHIADLLLEDKTLFVQYQNHREGMITQSYAGFEIYEDINAPYYDGSSLAKVSYGGSTSGKKDASVFFLKSRVAKARGSVKAYMTKASEDPKNRENVLGFRLHFLAIPLNKKGTGAIISG